MPEAETLAVRDLCVELPDRTVLRDVNFRIPPGSILGLCGPSGCGKTTLAHALLNLLPSPPFRVRGEVLLGDRNLHALSESEWRKVRGARIAIVFQDALLALNPVLRIRTQLAEAMRAHQVDRDPAELLTLAGLPDPGRILRAYPHQLSGGERQRVTLAQALSCRPGLILADEPFTALDAPRVVELAGLFRRLRDETGTSFLVISHSPGVLAYLADEVLRITSQEVLCGE